MIKERTNYRKKSITGKRMHLIIENKIYEKMLKCKQELGFKTNTRLIEYLLLKESNKVQHEQNHC